MTNGDGGEMPEWTRLGLAMVLVFVFAFAGLFAWDRYCVLQSNLALVEATERALLKQVETTESIIRGIFADPLPCEEIH